MLIEHMFDVNRVASPRYFALQSNKMRALLRRPSALIPLAISAFLIALIIAHVARFGAALHILALQIAAALAVLCLVFFSHL